MIRSVFACIAALALVSGASGVNVLVLSSDDQAIDSAVVQALQAGGHTVTVGAAYNTFTDAVDLGGIDTVYFQANINWANGDMPESGQKALLAFVDAGGGLVTGEWVVWKHGAQGQLKVLSAALPAVFAAFRSDPKTTFSVVTNDAVLSGGLPDSFEAPLDSYAGTLTVFTHRCGTTTYYNTSRGIGIAGWNYGIGRVLSIGTTNGPSELADANFARLFSNAMDWASLAGGHPGGYTPDCDGSGVLDLFDFLCFTNAFNAQQKYADCDGDGNLSLFDFLCFVNMFNLGC